MQALAVYIFPGLYAVFIGTTSITVFKRNILENTGIGKGARNDIRFNRRKAKAQPFTQEYTGFL